MTLQKAAQLALDVQSACNLNGVVNSFHDVMEAVRADTNGRGTDANNRHPICRLFAEQIAHLTGAGMGDTDTYSKAYDACQDMARGQS